MKILIKNLVSMKKLAFFFSNNLKINDYLLLYGDLSSGKTTFAKMLINFLGVNEIVTSPTFTILNEYLTKKNIKINHMDCYRLFLSKEKKNKKKLEIELIQFTEEFENSINIIEWPNIIYKYLNFNNNLIKIKIKILKEEKRFLKINYYSNKNKNNKKIFKNKFKDFVYKC